jgi:hypothetical protein
MWHRVAVVRRGVSEDDTASIIRVKRISELVTLAMSSSLIFFTLRIDRIRSSDMSFFSQRRENLKPHKYNARTEYKSVPKTDVCKLHKT